MHAFAMVVLFVLHSCAPSRCPLYNELSTAMVILKKETGTVRETAESPAGGRPLCEYCLSAVRV